jgi:hypothetical protein
MTPCIGSSTNTTVGPATEIAQQTGTTCQRPQQAGYAPHAIPYVIQARPIAPMAYY